MKLFSSLFSIMVVLGLASNSLAFAKNPYEKAWDFFDSGTAAKATDVKKKKHTGNRVTITAKFDPTFAYICTFPYDDAVSGPSVEVKFVSKNSSCEDGFRTYVFSKDEKDNLTWSTEPSSPDVRPEFMEARLITRTREGKIHHYWSIHKKIGYAPSENKPATNFAHHEFTYFEVE